MRWFKHMTNAHDDDKIVSIRDKFGMWGVGVYWDMVARAASQVTVRDPLPEFTETAWNLCVYYGCKTSKLVSFLEHLQNICQTSAKHSPDIREMYWKRIGNVFKITIPKVLEIKDNHLRNLQATCKSLASKEVEVEVEVDKKKKETRKKESLSHPKKSQLQLLTDEGVDPQIAKDYLATRKVKLTPTALAGLKREAKKAGISLQEAVKHSAEHGWRGFKADWMQNRKGAEEDPNARFKKNLAVVNSLAERRKRNGKGDF